MRLLSTFHIVLDVYCHNDKMHNFFWDCGCCVDHTVEENHVNRCHVLAYRLLYLSLYKHSRAHIDFFGIGDK